VLNAGLNYVSTMDQAIRASRQRQLDFQTQARMAQSIAGAIAEALPHVSGFDNDFTSVARSAIMMIGNSIAEIMTEGANQASLTELDEQNAKELAAAQQNIVLTTLRNDQAILTEITKLQQLVRQEVLSRLEIYNQQEALQQVAGRYQSALARG